MSRRRAWIALFLALLLTLPASARAAGQPKSSTGPYRHLFPRHSQVYVFRHETNGMMDCNEGFDCENQRPQFHLHTQDSLGRRSGWMRTGVWQDGARIALIAIFYSIYTPSETPISNAVAAWDDMRTAVSLEGWTPSLRHPRVGSDGHFAWYSANSGPQQAVVMAGTQGSVEVEGILISEHMHRVGRRALVGDLIRQMRAALRGEGP